VLNGETDIGIDVVSGRMKGDFREFAVHLPDLWGVAD
jgi:hypothetical protein